MVDEVNTDLSLRPGEGNLHQFLHGYSDGHRLLEGSMAIPDDLSRLVLRMSDLSGNNMRKGFEEYLTGYPLDSLNAYALAKTWYAPEMPRPGCVWTHTLVLPVSAMVQLPSLSVLKFLFRRPDSRHSSGTYSKPIPLAPVMEHEHVAGGHEEQRSTLMKALLTLHYDRADCPLLFAANASIEFEAIIFLLWSQKWPKLRMGLTFCTGSLSPRSLGKRPFDIQCVPASATREILLEMSAHGTSTPIVVNSAAVDTRPWITLAMADALRPAGGPVRAFLWHMSDASSERKEFISLMNVFDAVDARMGLPDLISLIAALFPSPSAGRRLKRGLLGEPLAENRFVHCEERDVLFSLATTEEFPSFSGEDLSMRERGMKLYRKDTRAATELMGRLLQSTPNPLGEEVLAGLISVLEPEDARQLAVEQPQFLAVLFRAKPSLASSAALWRDGGDRRRELFDSVASNKELDASVIAGIIHALLESGSEGFIKRSFDRWGKEAVFQVLNWAETQGCRLSETCQSALGQYLSFVMDWVEAKRRSVEVLTAIVPIVAPCVSQILRRDSSVWLAAFRSLSNGPADARKRYFSAFLLALALGNAPPSPPELLVESFEIVHESVRRQMLTDNAWIIIEPFVPELVWFSNWDKCERLRRGLVGAFVRYRWQPSQLTVIIEDKILLRELLVSARRVSGGEEYFRSGLPAWLL